MNEPRRILILTADAGFGHRSAANAVTAALQQCYGDQCQVTILNPLEDPRCPFFLRDSQADYDRIVQQVPDLYRFGYTASDAPVPAAIAESALTVLLFEVMYDILLSQRPDAILSTYPLYQDPLISVFSITRRYIPFYTVVTDLASVHRLWFHPRVSGLFVPNEAVRGLGLKNRIPSDKLILTGIPVHPDFVNEKRKKAEIRRALGWDPHLPTLLAVGSRRVERLMDAVQVINHFGVPIQVAAVAGRDVELFQKLQQVEWHQLAHLYEYASNMPEMMHAADGVICKAGGLVVTEALACGKPMLLIGAIPGQESGNAAFVVGQNAGSLVPDPMDFLEALSHWMQDGRRLLREQSRNAHQVGRPKAAFDIADLLWKAAQTGPVERKRIIGREHLLDLLNRFQVKLQDPLPRKFRIL